MAHPYARDFPPRRQTPPDCARRQLQQRPLVPDAGQAGHRQAPTREVEAQKAAAWRFGTAQAVGMHFFWGHKGHGTCPPQKSGGIKSEDMLSAKKGGWIPVSHMAERLVWQVLGQVVVPLVLSESSLRMDILLGGQDSSGLSLTPKVLNLGERSRAIRLHHMPNMIPISQKTKNLAPHLPALGGDYPVYLFAPGYLVDPVGAINHSSSLSRGTFEDPSSRRSTKMVQAAPRACSQLSGFPHPAVLQHQLRLGRQRR